MIIGIDLGTTFSVIAINGRAKLVAGYPEPFYDEKSDVSVIPDPFGNYIIPSVVWVDPEHAGEFVVGQQAKDAIQEGFSPIMFSKRNIGTNILHPLGTAQLTARQVAKELLIYLKGVAEQALGERVNRAVITHPAYFDPAMKEETALAARDAGFDFDQEKHLLMEPIAAALTFTRGDPRDPLRILTYDLGGGTFDVTVMERRKGVVTIKAFGGNRLLGGFNFDRELAQWLLRRLLEKGVQISLDEDNPEDRGKWSHLLELAEGTKLKLANARTDKVPVQIKQQAIFEDDNGVTINLTEQITREQFEALIQDMLDETIFGKGGEGETKGCNITLADAGLTIEQIDEILLVGGSSWGPWVTKCIKKAWNRETQFSTNPDLCVGIGAAIHATTVPEEIRGATYRIDLDVPKQSIRDIVNISGRVMKNDATPLESGFQATLTRPGKRIPSDVNADGYFLFEDVELQPETVTKFSLSVADSQGYKVEEDHHFEITHTPLGEDGATGVLTVLPKPLYIEVLGGMKPLAEEGATLPAHCIVELTRVHDDDTIEIRLFQEGEPIGSVVIEKVPKEAPIGAKVMLEVDVSRNNQITGRARVFTRKGAVAAESPVNIRIPPMQIPDKEFLRVEFDELESERQQRLDLERDAESRIVMEAKGSKLTQRINKALDSPVPDRQEIWLMLRQLKHIVNPPKDDMNPPMDQFERLVLRAKEILSTQGTDPQIQSHVKIVERLENEGRAAFAKKDRRSWAQINGNLEGTVSRLDRPANEATTEREVLPTLLQKFQATMLLDQIRQLLRAREAELERDGLLDRVRNRANRLRDDVEKIESVIEQIDDNMEPKAAQAQFQLIWFQKVEPLRNKIVSLGVDVR